MDDDAAIYALLTMLKPAGMMPARQAAQSLLVLSSNRLVEAVVLLRT